MRSPSLLLFAKEWRELLAARAYWLMLLVIGPLVGQSFISAVKLYAEASGIGGGPAALPQGLTPLDGMLVPTFGAYDLAVTLLFPFVAIRLIAAEKESGALKLALQLPARMSQQLFAKLLAISAGWLLAWLAGAIALLLWKSYGGHLAVAETLTLMAGHWLRMFLSAGLAVAAAALTESAASAAIVTLSFTLGSWALDFLAAGRSDWVARLAAYSPTAALRLFEQGMLQLRTVLVMLALGLAGFALAAIWLHTGTRWRTRLLSSLLLVLVTVAVIMVCARVRASWDVSENRRNSFAPAEEAALRRITDPLRVTVFLSPEDPRLMDLQRSILNKLQRLLPRVEIQYAAGTQTGLFETSGDHYGEIWYELGAQKVMNRSTTEPIVLEMLFQLAGITPPAAEENQFPGYPLPVHPRGAAFIFYFIWPAFTLCLWWLARGRRSRS